MIWFAKIQNWSVRWLDSWVWLSAMIVEKSPLYFELEVAYKLLKLHNAMEESNSSQHTKHTHTHTHIYIYTYTALLWYILQSLQCYINDTTNIFPQHCCNWSFPVRVFSPFEVRSSSHQMELHRFLNWVKTHSGKHQLNSQNKNYSVSKVWPVRK